MEIEDAKELFQTSDIALASYLYALGASLSGLDRSSPSRIIFLFELVPKQAEAVSKWKAGKATINALAYYESYRTLKRKLFSQL